jgi:16S rRNA (uracil1498-N3)-methyltransferase
VSPRGEGESFRAKVRARMAAALVQSGGAWLPEVAAERELADAIADAAAGERLLLDRDGVPLLGQAVHGATAPIWVALGPEGGVEAEERERLLAAGFQPVRLGASVLRFETAGVCAMALLQAAREVAVNGAERS